MLATLRHDPVQPCRPFVLAHVAVIFTAVMLAFVAAKLAWGSLRRCSVRRRLACSWSPSACRRRCGLRRRPSAMFASSWIDVATLGELFVTLRAEFLCFVDLVLDEAGRQRRHLNVFVVLDSIRHLAISTPGQTGRRRDGPGRRVGRRRPGGRR